MTPDRYVYVTYDNARANYAAYTCTGLRTLVGTGIEAIRDAHLIVGHAEGPRVAMWARNLADRGVVASVTMESVLGDQTLIEGPAARTLKVWGTSSLDGHPAERVMRYAPSGNVVAMAAAVGLIFDPHWFPVDPNRPERRSNLEAFFGLTPRHDHKRTVRRRLLTAVWYNPYGHPAPADFFARMFARVTAEGAHPHAAERRVNRYLLKCLLAAWDDESRPAGAERFFDPGVLFDSEAVQAVRGTD